jgi:hypothetical protein
VWLLAAALGLVAVGIGVAALVVPHDAHDGANGAKRGTPTVPAVSPTSTSTSSPSASGIDESTARATVVDYLNDVNARRKDAAGSLICEADYDGWKARADGPDSDFNFSVSKAVYGGSAPAPRTGGLVAHYTLTFDDGATNHVDFTVVDDHGPKICGIATR